MKVITEALLALHTLYHATAFQMRINNASLMHTLTAKTILRLRLLGVNQITVWGIVRRNQLYGHANRLRGGPRNRKVDQEMIDHMVAAVEDHPEYTLGQINTELRAALPNKPAVTEWTVAKKLKTQLIVLKKMETVQQDRNREDVCQARREYNQNNLTLD